MHATDLLAVLREACLVARAEVEAMLAVPGPSGGPAVIVPVFAAAPPRLAFVGQTAGAWASRVSWSPDERPFQWCWAAVVVEPLRPMLATVGPYDGEWHAMGPGDVPWFLASTAAAIRRSLELGRPMGPLKRTADPRLFNRVIGGEPPPLDRDGLI